MNRYREKVVAKSIAVYHILENVLIFSSKDATSGTAASIMITTSLSF